MLAKNVLKKLFQKTYVKEAKAARKRKEQRIKKHGKSWYDKVLDVLFPDDQ